MRALITGGAGFIGSHLAEALLERGREVVALDDLSGGRIENIRHLVGRPGFTFVQATVLDPEAVDPQVRDCDQIFHLAAIVGVKRVFQHPLRTLEVNVKGTEIVLEAAARHGRSVFLASTSEVYGRDRPLDGERYVESDDLEFGLSMRWCYASSKALDEYLARAYAQERSLTVVIGRFFNTVGPRQSPAYGMVMPRFVQQALAGQPITVFGDGMQVRSFGWVGEVVQATVDLMDTPQAMGQIFNIGSMEAVTVLELAQRAKRLTHSRSSIVHVPLDEAYGPGFDDVRYRVPDVSRLGATIGYAPTKSLDEILREVIAWFQRSSEGAAG